MFAFNSHMEICHGQVQKNGETSKLAVVLLLVKIAIIAVNSGKIAITFSSDPNPNALEFIGGRHMC